MTECSIENKITNIDIEEILRTIPHRYPMLLIDRVLELELDKYSKAIKNVTFNEPFFNGHFPEKPIMPGVLIIEAMAQTAGVLVRKTLTGSTKLVYFMTIENAKFRKPVVPGDQLELTATKIKSKANVWKFEGIGRVNGQVTTEATFSIAIVG